jgi:hypothetical protein
MRALVWKTDTLNRNRHTARKLHAVGGQYLIMRSRDGREYGVWNRTRCSVTGAMPTRIVGQAETLDQAKALAQADADDRHRNRRTTRQC